MAKFWNAIDRMFRRKPSNKTAEPVHVSAHHAAFIESIAQLIVTQVAPEELPVFEKLTTIYFADPTPPDLTAVPQYDPLSMGLGEVLVAVTPAATAVVVLALTYLSRHRPASAAEWEAQQAALHQSFNYEVGLQHLLNHIPEQHPKHSELLVFQVRLTENMAQQQLYGDTAELRHNRFQIIAQLNRLALEVVGESFNALSGMVSGISQARWQQLRQQGFQVAQEFGMTEEAAEQISTTMMSAFLTALWSKSDG